MFFHETIIQVTSSDYSSSIIDRLEVSVRR